eukprot:scaffold4044_cov399-Prasinococcus_capsulatus_cf.AAC.17
MNTQNRKATIGTPGGAPNEYSPLLAGGPLDTTPAKPPVLEVPEGAALSSKSPGRRSCSDLDTVEAASGEDGAADDGGGQLPLPASDRPQGSIWRRSKRFRKFMRGLWWSLTALLLGGGIPLLICTMGLGAVHRNQASLWRYWLADVRNVSVLRVGDVGIQQFFLAASIFTILTIPITLYGISMHLMYYTCPQEQRLAHGSELCLVAEFATMTGVLEDAASVWALVATDISSESCGWSRSTL